jgi:glycosyltransferase involved in cell wall biosynthesis
MKHVVIVPAHNEQAFIGRMLDSLVAQTERPDRVVVVDDGSTDATADIVRDLARTHPWIGVVQGPGDGERRYRVVEAFNAGYAAVRQAEFAYVSKLDADLVFPPDYFARLFAAMDRDPTIAAGSGTLYEVMPDGRRMRLRMPTNHVVGALKTMRKAPFDAMGGFLPTLGWDILDLVKLRCMGYRTANLPDLAVLHLRRLGSADGILRGNARMGHGAYVIGTHPLFAIGRSLYRMLEPPYVIGGLALGYGYFKSWLGRAPQIADRDLIRALQREQLYRLFHRNRMPAPWPQLPRASGAK